MSFYTNVQLVGDNIHYIGYEDGQRIQRKFKFSPTLFVVTNKQTKHRTLDGRYAKPVKFDSVREARQFVENIKKFLTLRCMVMTDICISLYLKSFLMK